MCGYEETQGVMFTYYILKKKLP